MKRSLKNILWMLIGASVLNLVSGHLLGEIAFETGRVIIALAGGWLVVSAAERSLWIAAAVGPLMLLIDHLVLKGGYFVIAHFFFPAAVDGNGLISAAGVLISYVFVLPIAAACSWLGGFLARRKGTSVDVMASLLSTKSSVKSEV